MNARDRARRYTAAELLAAGVAAGLRLRTPIKWIARQVTVRSAVASCVYTSGMAFLLSMVAADLLGAGAQPTHAQNVFLYYPLCTVVQLLCSPRHKLIATTVQQKSQLAAAKSLLSFSSSFFLTLHISQLSLSSPNNNTTTTGRDARNSSGESAAATGGASAGGAAGVEDEEGQGGVGELLEMLTRSFTDTLFRTLLYYVTLVELAAAGLLPLGLGRVLRVVLSAWMYVFNCLLVKWARFEWPTARVLAEFRARWLYYLGLGLPFSLLCCTLAHLPSVLLYCMLFPFFELLVLQADDSDKKGPHRGPDAQPLVLPVFFCAEWLVSRLFLALARLKARTAAGHKDPSHPKAT